jgi:hypothetical protein
MVVGKQAQPKNLPEKMPEKMELFYFSPKMRESMSCSEERRGCQHVALGKPMDMLLKNIFLIIMEVIFREKSSKHWERVRPWHKSMSVDQML